MTKDERIVLRVFEYEFFYAVSQWGETNTLEFPEPMVIYLDNQPGIPKESILHISFGSQGTFDYKIQNYMYLEHDVAELNRQKMIVLIPFQLLKLRSLIQQLIPAGQEEIPSLTAEDMARINQLQEQLRNDIIGSVEANVQFGNITMDDAKQLLELTELLYAHVLEECVYLKQIYAEPHKSYDYVNLTKASPISEADFHGLAVCICEALNRYTDLEKAGGCEEMKPLLDGAIELPNDKYRFRIDELEKQLAEYADENARYADENTKLRERIRELESQK